MPPHCALVGSLCASTDINVRCFCTTSFVYKTNHHLQSRGILVTKYSKNGELIKGPQRMILVIPKNAATDGQHCNGGTHILNVHPFSMVVGNGNIITQWCARVQCGTRLEICQKIYRTEDFRVKNLHRKRVIFDIC